MDLPPPPQPPINGVPADIRTRLSKLDTFTEWISSSFPNGYCCWENVELRDTAAGLGLFAKRGVRQNEPILRLPKELIVSAGAIADLPEYAFILESTPLDPFEVLTLFFFLEGLPLFPASASPTSTSNSSTTSSTVIEEFKHRRRHSQANSSRVSWAPYIDILPLTFTTPLAQLLEGRCDEATLLQSIEQLPLAAKQLFYKQRSEYEVVYSKIRKALGGWEHRRLFCWAFHVVNTRCIYVEHLPDHPLISQSDNTLAIIPLMDMMNHSTHAQCIARFDKHSQSYLVVAENTGVAEGEEVFVCYGPHDNARLYIEYGFKMEEEEENIFNRVPIPIDLFIALAKNLPSAAGVEVTPKHEATIREAAIPCTLYGSDDECSYGLKINCRLLLMRKGELKRWRDVVFNRELEEEEGCDSPYKVLLNGILTQLLARLNARAAEVKDSFIRGFWDDQIKIVKRILENSMS